MTATAFEPRIKIEYYYTDGKQLYYVKRINYTDGTARVENCFTEHIGTVRLEFFDGLKEVHAS